MSETNNIDITGVLTYSSETGLSANPKSSILDDLKKITASCFGNDFNVEQGTEWYSFLDALASVLSDCGGAAVNIFNSCSVNNATGIALDALCARIGIRRKSGAPSTVDITCTNSTSSDVDFTPSLVYLRDDNNNLWQGVSSESITVSAGDEVSCSFKCVGENQYMAVVQASTNWTVASFGNSGNKLSFKNESASVTGYAQESDGQLRYRYVSSTYLQAASTVDALKARILSIPEVSYCYIYNNTGSDAYNLGDNKFNNIEGHAIWVVVDTDPHKSCTDLAGSKTAETIAEYIVRYKSLGCGITSGLELTADTNFSANDVVKLEITGSDIDSHVIGSYTVYFVVASARTINATVDITSKKPDNAEDNNILQIVNDALVNYLSSLSHGESITNLGVSSAVYAALQDSLYAGTDVTVEFKENNAEFAFGTVVYPYQYLVLGTCSLKSTSTQTEVTDE